MESVVTYDIFLKLSYVMYLGFDQPVIDCVHILISALIVLIRIKQFPN